MVRLGIPEDKPLAVQQCRFNAPRIFLIRTDTDHNTGQGLIAINYPARAFDLSRHVTITEARQKCPEIIMQHVATWKEGDAKWAYHDDAFANIATHKVSLDPYRLQSRRILALMKEELPAAPIQRIEKASIDEVFLDLSAQVHSILLERYPELRGPPPYDDPTEKLPAPSTTALDWNADALIDLDTNQTEEDAPDWDDIAMLIGSEIVRKVRLAVREKLGYTCSAGIARNKTLAKLGAGHKKPNNQTIIRNRAIQQFLSGFKFTKIRNLGGKLGDEIVEKFGTDSVLELLQVPVEQLKKQLGDDTGTWLYQTIRGEDGSEVNPRTQIKSMLSAKSFRPSINNFDVAVKWLRIFVADIFCRLVEEGVCENKRRPKTINIHHRQGAQTRSRQAPIPMGRPIEEGMLFELAKNLLAQVVVDGRAWPCAMISLSVGGFEDGVTGNKGIGGFLLHGDAAKAMKAATSTSSVISDGNNTPLAQPNKRRRVEDTRINNFFLRQEESTGGGDDELEPTDFDDLPSAQREPPAHSTMTDMTSASAVPSTTPTDDQADMTSNIKSFDMPSSSAQTATAPSSPPTATIPTRPPATSASTTTSATTSPTFSCPRCTKILLADQRAEHDDWHFAQELMELDQAEQRTQLQQQQQRQHQQQQQAKAKGTAKGATTPGPLKPRPPAGGSGSGRGRGRPPGSGAGGTSGSAGGGSAGSEGAGLEKGQKRLAFGR